MACGNKGLVAPRFALRPSRSFQAASPVTRIQTFDQVCLAAHCLLRLVSEHSRLLWAPGAGIRLSCRRFVASCSALDRPPRDEAADPPERQAACFWRKLL